METQKKEKRLSHKEKGFVRDIVRGENGTQAALNNYDTKSENSASTIASENLRKLKIVNAIEAALPDELLANVHKEGLAASKDNEPDYAVRAKYLDMGYKIKGAYAQEVIPPEKSTNTYNFLFSADIQKEVKEIEDKIKAKLIRHVQED